MAPVFELTTSKGIELSVHECPTRIRSEVRAVFPGVDVERLLIVPTCQHSSVDLVQFGEAADAEKDKLLEQFMEWAEAVCNKLIQEGHWADYIDPCSGLPMVHRDQGNTVYPEVEGLSVLMGYKTSNAGCCKVLLHPKWGSAVYPASMFTLAPLERLRAAIEAVEQASNS